MYVQYIIKNKNIDDYLSINKNFLMILEKI